MSDACKWWRGCGRPDGGRCHHPKIHLLPDGSHAKVSFGVCNDCEESNRPGWVAGVQKELRLGTAAEMVIGAIPMIKRLPCYDDEGKLKPNSKCKGRSRRWDGKTSKR